MFSGIPCCQRAAAELSSSSVNHLPSAGMLRDRLQRITNNQSGGFLAGGLHDKLNRVIKNVKVDKILDGKVSQLLDVDEMISNWGNLLNMDWLTCDMFSMLQLDGVDDMLGDLLETLQIDDMLSSLQVDHLFQIMGINDMFDKLGIDDILNLLGIDNILKELGFENILDMPMLEKIGGMDEILREFLKEEFIMCELDRLVDKLSMDLNNSGETAVLDTSNIDSGKLSVLLPDGAVAGEVLVLTVGGPDGVVIHHVVTAEEATRGVVDMDVCPSDGIVAIQADLGGAMSAPVRGVIGGYCDTSTGTPTSPPTSSPHGSTHTSGSTYTSPPSSTYTSTYTSPPSSTYTGTYTSPPSSTYTSPPSRGRPVLSTWNYRVGEVQVDLPEGVKSGEVLSVRMVRDDGTVDEVKHTVTPEEAESGIVLVMLPPSDDPVQIVTEVNGGVSEPITTTIPTNPVVDVSNVNQGTIDLTLPIGTVVGDVVDIIITGPDGSLNATQHMVTKEELSRGYATANVDISDGRSEIVVDVAGGNSGPVEVYGVEGLSIPDASDGLITDEENSGGIPATIALPEAAKVGDVIDVVVTKPDGTTETQPYELTEEDINRGVADIVIFPLDEVGSHTVAASLGGEPIGEPLSLNSVISIVGPGMRVPDNEDGVIEPSEIHGGIETYAELPYGTQVGDVVTLAVRNPSGQVDEIPVVVTQEDLDAGELMVLVPELQEIGEYGVAAKVGDGKYGAEEVMRVDELVQFDSTLTSEDIVNGFVTPYTYYKPDHPELHNTIVSDVSLPNVVAVGDEVEVVLKRTDGSGSDVVRRITITEEMKSDGRVQAVLSEIGEDGEYEMIATFSRDGTQLAQSNKLPFELDTVVPGDANGDGVSTQAPSVKIPAADDEKFNKEEIDAGVEVVVTLPAGTEEGDTITVEVRDANGDVVAVKTGTADGSEEMTVVLDNMGDLEDGDYSISAVVSDDAGNKSPPSSPESVEKATVMDGSHSLSIGALDDGVITLPELKADVPVDITLDGVKAGETLVIEITDETGAVKPIEHVITEQEAAAGSALLYITELGEAGDQELVSYIRDTAGNESEKETLKFAYDDSVPGDTDGDGVSDLNPTITIADAEDRNITAAENADGVLVHVDIPPELKKSLSVGDEILLSVQGPTGEPVPVSHIIGQDELDQGYFEHKIDPLTEDGHYSVSGVIRDESGGSTTSVAVSFELDTKVPGDTDGDGVPDTSPEIVFDDLNNGYINGEANRPHVDVTVTVPANTEEGDTILVMISKAGSDEVDVKRVPVDSLASSTIDVDLPSFADQGEYEVWVQVEDEVGNKSTESDRTTVMVDTLTPGDTTKDGVSDTVVTAVMDNTEDGVLTSDELAQSSDIAVAIPEGTQPGDTVTVSVTTPDGTEVPLTHVVEQSDIDNGTVGVDVSSALGDDGVYLLSAVIEDAAGNASLSTDTPLGFSYHTNEALITSITYEDDTEVQVGASANAYGEGDIKIDGQLKTALLDDQQVLIREPGGTWTPATVYKDGDYWNFYFWNYDDDPSGRTPGETVNYEYTIGKSDGQPIDKDDIHQFDVTFTGTTTPNLPPTYDVKVREDAIRTDATRVFRASGHAAVSRHSPIDDTTLHLVSNSEVNELHVIRTDKDHEIMGNPINVGFNGEKDVFYGQDMVFFPDGTYAVCMYAENRKAGNNNFSGTFSYVVYMDKDDTRLWSRAITYKAGYLGIFNCQLTALNQPDRIGVVVMEWKGINDTSKLNYYTISLQGTVTFKKTLKNDAYAMYMPHMISLPDNRFALASKINTTANLKVEIRNSINGDLIQTVLNVPTFKGEGDTIFNLAADTVNDELHATAMHVVYIKAADDKKIEYVHCPVSSTVQCTTPITALTLVQSARLPRVVTFKDNVMINYYRRGTSFGVGYIDRQGNLIKTYDIIGTVPDQGYIYTLNTSVLNNGHVLITGVYRVTTTYAENFSYTLDETEWCEYHMKKGALTIENVDDVNSEDTVSFTMVSAEGTFSFDASTRTAILEPYQKPDMYTITATDSAGNETVKDVQWPPCRDDLSHLPL